MTFSPVCINRDFCKSRWTYRVGPFSRNNLSIYKLKQWKHKSQSTENNPAWSLIWCSRKRKWNCRAPAIWPFVSPPSETPETDYIVWENHVYPSVIPLLLMWLMYVEEEDWWRRFCDFPVVKIECLALAALALDSFLTPAPTAKSLHF